MALDAPDLVGVVVDGGVQTEADIADADLPIEVEDVDRAVVTVGDDRSGLSDVLRNADLADEVVAATAGDDAQRGCRPHQTGRDRAHHPVAAEGDDDRLVPDCELGGEVGRILLAGALDQHGLQTVGREGALQRADPLRDGTVACRRVEDDRDGRQCRAAHSALGPFMSFPGFMIPTGSTSPFAARSIRIHSSPCSFGSQGAWSAPAEW